MRTGFLEIAIGVTGIVLGFVILLAVSQDSWTYRRAMPISFVTGFVGCGYGLYLMKRGASKEN